MALGAAVLVAAAAVPLSAAPPAIAAPGIETDFNGDGFGDIAIGAPAATVDDEFAAGAVIVMYGSATGLEASQRTVVTQNSTGVPDSAEVLDHFGSELATGDFNGDGYTDLVVGTPNEYDDSFAPTGLVTVHWGSATGVSGAVVAPVPVATDAYRYFGQALAVGDFDDDDVPDLAVASGRSADETTGELVVFPGGFNGSGPIGTVYEVATLLVNRVGALLVTAGDITGDGADDLVIFGLRSVPGGFALDNFFSSDVSDGPGASWLRMPGGPAAIGDLTNDGRAEIAIGQPNGSGIGRVSVYPGTASGPVSRTVITQDTPGVPGGGEPGDRFGSELSIADTDGDAYGDLAIGAIYESVGSIERTGAVTVVRGSASGVTTSGALMLHQDLPDVLGFAEAGDNFGASFGLADVTGDSRAELVAGGPGEDAEVGAVWSFPGSTAGVTAVDSALFTAADLGFDIFARPLLGERVRS